jgi:hypothetical protein
MSEQQYEEMSSLDLLKEMKDMMKVLEKKVKASESQQKKLEAKEEKRVRAAPTAGVRPSQLEESNAWVEYVHQHMVSEGWAAFTHKERYGKGVAEIEFPESEEIALPGGADGETVHVFRGVQPAQQPSLSHAMSVSKVYKEAKPDLYSAWKAAWDAEHPAEEEKVKAVKAAKPAVRAMTLAEKLAEKAHKEEEKEAEKERKKQEREEKKREKDAEKARLKEEKEEAKRVASLNKSVKGGPKAAVLRAAVPVAKAASVLKMAKPLVSAAKPVAAAKQPVWVPPENLEDVDEWVVKGVTYLRDGHDYLFERKEDGDAGECVGKYHPEANIIDASDKVVIVESDQ